ncbi:putative hydrolase [compost metagenome]
MKINKQTLLNQAKEDFKYLLEPNSNGNDYWHTVRVMRNAALLAELEQADVFLCELAALLYISMDRQLNESQEAKRLQVENWLQQSGLDLSDAVAIGDMVYALLQQFENPMITLEGRIVQDAVRLDAIGAVGLARVFANAGWRGDLIYDPKQQSERLTRQKESGGRSSAIEQVYDELLQHKSMIHTKTGQVIAEQRDQFIKLYLRELDQEWELGNESYLDETLLPTPISRVHIAFDDSASGSLRVALRGLDGEKVVCLNDNLMVGPLSDIHEQGGFAKRLQWWEESMNGRDREEAAEYLLMAAIVWCQWPARLDDLPIVIWASDSAAEQIGLRRLLAVLSKEADVSLVNPSTLLNRGNSEQVYQHTGEISSEKLAPLLVHAERLLPEAREVYISDWYRLIAEEGVLRLFEDGKLRSVSEDYFDESILLAARKLKAFNGKYIKSARLVGEVIGYSEQRISDSFIEYRVRRLIEARKLSYTGDLKAMRYYSVCLVEEVSRSNSAKTPKKNWMESIMPELEEAAETLQDMMAEAKASAETWKQLSVKLTEIASQAVRDSGEQHGSMLLQERMLELQAQNARNKELWQILSGMILTAKHAPDIHKAFHQADINNWPSRVEFGIIEKDDDTQ